MLEVPNRDRAAERRDATRREIVHAAWEVAAEHGLAGVTLREVGSRVGMRAPSLYTHFSSKNAIYDAMFGQAWTQYEQAVLESKAQLPVGEPLVVLRAAARHFFDFAVANPVRYQLMNQRTIPGFDPSPQSYAPAVRVLAISQELLAQAGVKERADFDIWVALMTGMVDQQLANDPGGTRLADLVDRAVEVFATGIGLPLTKSTKRTGRRPVGKKASSRRAP